MEFVWNEDYKVNVKIFDEQHQHFFELANKVNNLVESGESDKQKILTVISEFGDYGLYHLAAEDECFKKYNYEDREAHMKAHEAYREKIKEYLEQTRETDDARKIAEELVYFSIQWLKNHILSMDKQYSSFCCKCGIE